MNMSLTDVLAIVAASLLIGQTGWFDSLPTEENLVRLEENCVARKMGHARLYGGNDIVDVVCVDHNGNTYAAN